MNIIDRFNAFKNEWLGKRVDFDHVFQFQCVDLVLQYIYELFNIKGEYGNAIDYWTNPSAVLFPVFQKVQTTDVKIGDVVIFVGLAGNPYGHIGIATGNQTDGTVEILEQNGATGGGTGLGGDAIRTRFVNKSRVAGVLRPTTVTYGEAEAAPAPDGYILVKTVPGYGNSNNAANNINKLVDMPAGSYHVFSEAHGMVNVTRTVGTPGAWINPSDNVNEPAPAPAAPQLPTKPANIVFTKLEKPIELIVNKDPTNVWHLDFSNDAHAVSASQVAQGTPFTAFGKAQRTDGDKPCYYMTEADFGAADVTGIPASDVGVNTVDLSPAPAPIAPQVSAPAETAPQTEESEAVHVPVTVKSWKDSFSTDNAGVYRATKDATINDLEGTLPAALLGHDQTVHVAGFVTKDGEQYAITVKSHSTNHWYGIPKNILVTNATSDSSKVNASKPAAIAHAVVDDIDRIAADLNKDPEYAKFKTTLKPRGKLVADIAEAEDKVAGLFNKVNFFKRKYK